MCAEPLAGARRFPLIWLAVGGAAALGSSQSSKPARERLLDDSPPTESRPPPTRPASALPYPPCPAPRGTLPRRSLEVILSRGPGVFLSGLDVARVPASAIPEAARQAWPGLAGSHGGAGFGGWRVERFHPGDPCLGRAGLRPGDIVVSVNGNVLRRPEDLGSLWNGLGQAQHVVTRLVRQGEPLTFIVHVTGPPRAAPDRPTP